MIAERNQSVRAVSNRRDAMLTLLLETDRLSEAERDLALFTLADTLDQLDILETSDLAPPWDKPVHANERRSGLLARLLGRTPSTSPA